MESLPTSARPKAKARGVSLSTKVSFLTGYWEGDIRNRDSAGVFLKP